MIATIIYLTGYVAAYLLGRKSFIKYVRIWTVSDRNNMLFFSLLSWIGFLTHAICILTDYDNNKPAKW